MDNQWQNQSHRLYNIKSHHSCHLAKNVNNMEFPKTMRITMSISILSLNNGIVSVFKTQLHEGDQQNQHFFEIPLRKTKELQGHTRKRTKRSPWTNNRKVLQCSKIKPNFSLTAKRQTKGASSIVMKQPLFPTQQNPKELSQLAQRGLAITAGVYEIQRTNRPKLASQ